MPHRVIIEFRDDTSEERAHRIATYMRRAYPLDIVDAIVEELTPSDDDRVEVLVGVSYFNDGNSTTIFKRCHYAVAPQADDQIEILPARRDDDRRLVEAWHERVADRWLHVTENEVLIEVHVEVNRLDKEDELALLAAGYRKAADL